MRNIVLITLDSVRADHCSFMGYERKTTPNLDKIARKGIVFKNAVAPAPRTNPSMPQIFTGKLIEFVSTNPYIGERENTRRHLRLNETLAEKLSKRGYTTCAFCPNAYTSRYFGFNKGFDYFQDFLFAKKTHQKIFEKMVGGNKIFSHIRNIGNLILKQEVFKTWESYYDEIIEWISKAKEPFFLWVFLLDTHLPWLVPRRFRKWGNFFDMYYSGWMIFRVLNKQNANIPEKVKRKLINAYDDSIYYADSFIGKLQKDLEDYDPIFVIHSDHGEEFGERGFYGHYYPHLYEENIHVPLVIGNLDEGREIEKPVSLVNLPEIILNLSNSSSLDSFLSNNSDWIIAKDFDYISKRNVIAVRIKDWKYIMGQGNVDELYNLRDDPYERINLINEYPRLAKEMKKIAENQIKVRKRKIGLKYRGEKQK
ncbi:MAG TPA: hypothetical protein ENG63_06875 [Candidatus Desulfofervidus auxilii]|uniref:Sulfatase N-terminal domain-containing protein n=1 Tax=Desulfofervidus auxilii TaxID=1621989 RepID=A0A7C0U2X9_DESA2|nr:hypothetical protein [Candidatus Desulfofervidus auxilii]